MPMIHHRIIWTTMTRVQQDKNQRAKMGDMKRNRHEPSSHNAYTHTLHYQHTHTHRLSMIDRDTIGWQATQIQCRRANRFRMQSRPILYCKHIHFPICWLTLLTTIVCLPQDYRHQYVRSVQLNILNIFRSSKPNRIEAKWIYIVQLCTFHIYWNGIESVCNCRASYVIS